MPTIRLNTSLVRSLIKLGGQSKLSNLPQSQESIFAKFGIPVPKYVYGGYRFLAPVTVSRPAEGHNYPYNLPILPVMAQKANGGYRTYHMMGLYVYSNTYCIGNWLPSSNSNVSAAMPMASFAATLPSDGPLVPVSMSGYPASSDSDIDSFVSLLNRLSKVEVACG